MAAEEGKASVTTPVTTDPITTEIIRNLFQSCAQDMNATLFRSAYTPVIYEGLDCAVALLDENADVLGQAAGILLFVGNLEVCVKLTTEAFGIDIYEPGDIFYMNDPYLQGTHLNDATIFGPIFVDGELVGFSATRAHWLDVGGKDPGMTMDSTEVYQEGVRWGPTKIVSRYAPREDLIDLLRRNSRFGYSLIGDMNAQIAACRTGEERLQAIIARFDSTRSARPRPRSLGRPPSSTARRSRRSLTASTSPRATSTTTALATSRCSSKCASRSPATGWRST